MKETIYCCEKTYLENYLQEKASITAEEMQGINASWDKTVYQAGSLQAVDGIYSLEGNTAHIAITGPLSLLGPDIVDLFFGLGGTSYKTINGALNRAKNDPMVKEVVLDIDSPGGAAAGADEIWTAVSELGKPVETHAGSLLASAAYWIASASDKIYASSPVTRCGSIGVMAASYDISKQEENRGIKKVVITSSNAPDKQADISTEKGRRTIKEQLDALERIFYSRVEEGRGVTAEHIAEHFGKGGLLVAQDPSAEHEDAIRSGMIDGLVKKKTFKNINQFLNPSLEGKNMQAGEKAMTLKEIMAQNPEAKAEIETLLKEEREKAKAEYSARVDKVLPIIQSAAYPANIKTIACNVLAGKEEMAAFTASVAVFDSAKEAAASKEAAAETAEIGSVNAEAPGLAASGEKELDAALNAEIAKRKEK